MMKYNIKIINNTPDWKTLEKAELHYAGWNTYYTPETYAQIAYQKGIGMYLRMECMESNPKAIYKKYMDPVARDSCMECFFSVTEGKYLNIEVNSNGAMHSAIGMKKERIPVSEYITPFSSASAFPIKIKKTEKSWSAEILISNQDLFKIFGIEESILTPGYTLKGNFYKCGDWTDAMHYLMWNPVQTKNPDFHRPEFFGEFVLK